MSRINVAVLRIRDGCASNDDTDDTRLHLTEMISGGILGNAKVIKNCAGYITEVKNKLQTWTESGSIHLILTLAGIEGKCGNTVKSATLSLVGIQLPGILELMGPLPPDVASYIVCGICRNTLILNLPDSVVTSRRCLSLASGGIIQALSLFLGSSFMLAPEALEGCSKLSATDAERFILSVALRMQKKIDLESVKALDFVLAEGVPEFPLCDIRVNGYAELSSGGNIQKGVMEPNDDSVTSPENCVGVHSGAAVPNGADGIVEEEEMADGDISQKIAYCMGNNIIRKGNLGKALTAGTYLTNDLIERLRPHVKLVKVYNKPSVMVSSSSPHSNDIPLLVNIIESLGPKCNYFGYVSDDISKWREFLIEAFKNNDVVVSTKLTSNNCIFSVLRNYFLCNIFFTRVKRQSVYFANITVKNVQKLWFGFNTCSGTAEMFVVKVLSFITGHRYFNSPKGTELSNNEVTNAALMRNAGENDTESTEKGQQTPQDSEENENANAYENVQKIHQDSLTITSNKIEITGDITIKIN